jgi:uncharacterized tellurite resistance protein B-like protein
VEKTLLEGYTDAEKGAYLGAIASLATADRQATAEEIEYLDALSTAANLSPAQASAVKTAAAEINSEETQRCLDVLKTSELRFSFVADLVAFAKSDQNYSEEEQQMVHQMAGYLGVTDQQFAALSSFSEKATASSATPEEMSKPSFLSSLGLQDKLQSAGINGGSLLKGLISIAGPMILGKMLGGRRGGGLAGSGGGMMGGGLGSLIGMLSGGRGMGSLGGMLGGLLGGKRGF